jgi:hypothetical protein
MERIIPIEETGLTGQWELFLEGDFGMCLAVSLFIKTVYGVIVGLGWMLG